MDHGSGELASLNEAVRTALPISGDDDAKVTVVEFLDRLGYDAVDAGPLSEGWRFQRDTAAYAVPYGAAGNIREPRPASVDVIRVRLAEALRYRDVAS